MTPLSLPPSLSQYSEENMMDPYNLAICFGPTLMSVPEGHDQVSCQAHVNELIKTIIIHHDTIFPGPQDLQGPIYTIPRAGDDFWWVCMWGGSFRSDKSSEVAIWIAKASETAGNVLFNCYLTRGGLMMMRRTERKRGGVGFDLGAVVEWWWGLSLSAPLRARGPRGSAYPPSHRRLKYRLTTSSRESTACTQSHTSQCTQEPSFNLTLITSPSTSYYDYCQSVELFRL